MSATPDGESGGLFAALKNIAATLLASGSTRLELLSNEIELGKLRAIRLMLLGQGIVFCFGVSSVLAIALCATLFWESRLIVLGLAMALFLILGIVFSRLFTRATQQPEQLFAGSIAELQEDLRQLKAAAGHDQSTK